MKMAKLLEQGMNLLLNIMKHEILTHELLQDHFLSPIAGLVSFLTITHLEKGK